MTNVELKTIILTIDGKGKLHKEECLDELLNRLRAQNKLLKKAVEVAYIEGANDELVRPRFYIEDIWPKTKSYKFLSELEKHE